MFDARLRPLIDPPLNRLGAMVARFGVSANQVTLIGLMFGLLAAVFISFDHSWIALMPLLLSRLADGLDGAVARQTGGSDFGGFLDITCDFAFYGAVPLGFVLLDPSGNGAAGAFLLTSFYINGGSFLGYAVLAEKHGMKSSARGQKALYFTGGLLEGGETIAFFVLLCLFPAGFAAMAWIFGGLCLLTAASRVLLAWQVFGDKRSG
jgi:phosphatidylglycerophosphate synthase